MLYRFDRILKTTKNNYYRLVLFHIKRSRKISSLMHLLGKVSFLEILPTETKYAMVCDILHNYDESFTVCVKGDNLNF